MASVIIMPKQGLLMEEGTITSWLVKEGGTVKEGEPLFEMETDKLTITMDSTATGTVLKIIHPEGDVVAITKPIAIVGEPGEDISALLGSEGAAPAAKEEEPKQAQELISPNVVASAPAEKVEGEFSCKASPRAKMVAQENGISISDVAGTGPEGFIIERDVKAFIASGAKATPLAKNIAAAEGKSLDGVAGSGVGGKIVVSDLAPAEAAAQAATPAASATRGTRSVPMTGMRKAISKNMMVSKETNAQTCHFMSVDMTESIKLREAYKAKKIKVSYNDIIMKVCAKALMDYPIVNASVDGNNILYHDYVNIGNAIAVSNGLIVPNIKNADQMTIVEIAKKDAEFIDKAKNGALGPDDYHGGTFTITSLGMFDVDEFVAIINPPESAILAVGKITKTPVVVTDEEGNDTIVIKPIMKLCLSYDHRIIDGADAAKFLKQVKDHLEFPAMML